MQHLAQQYHAISHRLEYLQLMRQELSSLIYHNFPQHGMMTLGIAYGSAVFPQKIQSLSWEEKLKMAREGKLSEIMNSQNMIDLILSVEDPSLFHEENLLMNKHHYSTTMKLLGHTNIVSLQNSGAKIYYNPYVNLKAPTISDQQQSSYKSHLHLEKNYSFKYGIIRHSDLIHDLEHWSSLYVAGRLHKPVLFVKPKIALLEQNDKQIDASSVMTTLFLHEKESKQLVKAQHRNLQNALYCALVLLPEQFTLQDLYCMICRLSYMGDVRTKVVGNLGESVNKVFNIVEHNYELFQVIYLDILKENADLVRPEMNLLHPEADPHTVMKQDKSKAATTKIINSLPTNVRLYMAERFTQAKAMGVGFDRNNSSEAEQRFLMQQICLSSSEDQKHYLQYALNQIVRQSSRSQTLKGILTAGVWKSTRYAWAKIKKSLPF